MRLFLGCMLAVALALSPALAGTNDSRTGGSGDAKASDAVSNSTSEAAAKPDASAEAATNDTELPEAPSPAADSSSSASSAPASSASASGTASASLPASSTSKSKKSSSKSAANVARPLPTDPQNSGAEAAPSPLSFNIGSAKFTPGGFVDLTNFFRSKDIGSGIGTSFNGVPYNNSLPLAALTEDHFSLQNSRVTLRVDSTVAGGAALGYLEADFLGFTNDNLNVTSNSDTLRMRVYFFDYRRGKIEVLGGQDWSMLTPSRTGIAVMPADVFNTQDMDTNYQCGLAMGADPAVPHHIPSLQNHGFRRRHRESSAIHRQWRHLSRLSAGFQHDPGQYRHQLEQHSNCRKPGKRGELPGHSGRRSRLDCQSRF